MFEYQLPVLVCVKNEPMKPAAKQIIMQITSNKVLFMSLGKVYCLKKLAKKSIHFNSGEKTFVLMQEYHIKELPEDFVVKENSNVKLADKGRYSVFRLWKRDYTSEKAVQQVADSLHIYRKRFGYAGNKDSKAVTEQSISIHNVDKEKVEKLSLKDIKLEFLGYSNEPISLGDLDGNSFDIVVRNISRKPKPVSRIINYFGEQRFSTNNAEIGKAIIQKDFKKAVDRIIERMGDNEKRLVEHLQKNKNDYVGAIKEMPWKTLTMYVHAYQSKLWNETVQKLVKSKALPALTVKQAIQKPELLACEEPKVNKSVKNKKVIAKTKKIIRPQAADSLTNLIIPIVGFATEIKDEKINAIVEEILAREEISRNDFIIRSIPELSSAGDERSLFVDVKDLVIGELEPDDLNIGKKKVRLTFSLGKGSYATEVVKELFS